MTTTNWITLTGILVALCGALYIAYRRGDLKTVKLYVTPSKLKKGLGDEKFFKKLNHKIPAVGILNFFQLPIGKHKKICFHVYITVENPTKYAIEDTKITLLYPRKLCDETDQVFFKPNGNSVKNNLEILYVDEHTVQATYSYENLHPLSVHQIMHPIIIDIDDCFKELDVDNELLFKTSSKGFSFYNIHYMITAKNLSLPVKNNFWLINIIGENEKAFFNGEKKFLNSITKNFKFERYFFEKRHVNKFQEGKSNKQILVVESSDLNITYSSFPPIKNEYGIFNFEDNN